jgi:hypothetical protein
MSSYPLCYFDYSLFIPLKNNLSIQTIYNLSILAYAESYSASGSYQSEENFTIQVLTAHG